MKATHTGQCQICGRDQKLPNGELSKHGYRVADYGFFMGTCHGAGHLPYEKSCAKIVDVMARQVPVMVALKQKIEDTLKEDQVAWINMEKVNDNRYAKRQTVQAEVKKIDHERYSEFVFFKEGYKDVNAVRHSFYGQTKEEVALKANAHYATYVLERELKQMEKWMDWQADRVAKWELRELVPVAA